MSLVGRACGWIAVGCIGVAFALPVSAQDGTQVVAEKSFVNCLLPSAAERGQPDYPEQQKFTKTGGVVRVALTFTGKDSSPQVRFLNRNDWNELAFENFSRSVERFVSKYRLPCMGDAPVVIHQEFNFSPDSRKVFAMDAGDGPDEMSRAKCRFEYVGDKPAYPTGSASPYGNVYSHMTYRQRDEPPKVDVIYNGGHYLLAEVTKSWLQQTRLRCESPLEKPVVTTHLHRFTPSGGAKVTLKDMAFIPFLKSVKRETWGKPKFDMNQMACPFEVKVQLLQPHAPNVVREVDTTDPRRKEFLQWLTTLVFSYPDGYERFLVGETMTMAVPCMSLDLT